ncbi:folate-binding protein YgfZ [Deinococcus irradiatisoli]|uniref:Folate-binding protein YgfZ n=1 Tax=Deinococcus irradiatisoli TaxID=2202254 RepID=A0A2Z3JAD1_9DEIO|nr:folate-binding protein YgfZ [Deinococcus irradiatisoli]AWN22053.1 folate-binding protein YgfZ [Deinococcus irradiatisoli]
MTASPPALTRLPSSALRLSGADRLDFVQGQMTNNLKAAPTPGMVAACFLNPKGQIELFARIYKREHDIYLHLAEGQAPLLAARFRKYIIFDQVEVQDLSQELATLHVWSQTVPGWAQDGPDVQNLTFGEAGFTVLAGRVNRSGDPGLDLHYLRRHEDALLSALNAEERPLDELEAARIRASISDAAQDGWAGYLPQEVGLDSAMSYRKGCYVGQEIMARLEARGNTRYHLAQLSGEQLPPHSDVTLEGKVVGRSGASSGTLTLARLRKDLPADAALQVGGVSARLSAATESAL